MYPGYIKEKYKSLLNFLRTGNVFMYRIQDPQHQVIIEESKGEQPTVGVEPTTSALRKLRSAIELCRLLRYPTGTRKTE